MCLYAFMVPPSKVAGSAVLGVLIPPRKRSNSDIACISSSAELLIITQKRASNKLSIQTQVVILQVCQFNALNDRLIIIEDATWHGCA